MIVVGLTGSIAMGKTETAKMFRALGVEVFDSDAEVHRQYERGGEGVKRIAQLFPEAVVDGSVDRKVLSERVLNDPEALQRLERAIHPLVRKKQDEFLARCRAANQAIVVLDIPLLFETGRDTEADAIVVASAPGEVQRQRVLQRPGMTIEKFDGILSRQTPDTEKRARADYVVDTSKGMDSAAAQVRDIITDLLHNRAGNP
jgi:dephospho-CoA kinase